MQRCKTSQRFTDCLYHRAAKHSRNVSRGQSQVHQLSTPELSFIFSSCILFALLNAISTNVWATTARQLPLDLTTPPYYCSLFRKRNTQRTLFFFIHFSFKYSTYPLSNFFFKYSVIFVVYTFLWNVSSIIFLYVNIKYYIFQ